ncbi:hypothetical protein AND_008338 [Anopheles darlingi]|uniref:Uncharacterized protein n=1 Tax=Anopheles darlingi TaxID=43151 RepID=W5J6H2_ANODA|nr:hypothetical protein AND_008338 [Anopheles darlingi]
MDTLYAQEQTHILSGPLCWNGAILQGRVVGSAAQDYDDDEYDSTLAGAMVSEVRNDKDEQISKTDPAESVDATLAQEKRWHLSSVESRTCHE